MAAKAAITTRLAGARLLAIDRMVSLRQIIVQRAQHPGRSGNAGRVQVTPPHVMRRFDQGTGSIEVTVRQSQGGAWAGKACRSLLLSPGGESESARDLKSLSRLERQRLGLLHL